MRKRKPRTEMGFEVKIKAKNKEAKLVAEIWGTRASACHFLWLSPKIGTNIILLWKKYIYR